MLTKPRFFNSPFALLLSNTPKLARSSPELLRAIPELAIDFLRAPSTVSTDKSSPRISSMSHSFVSLYLPQRLFSPHQFELSHPLACTSSSTELPIRH